MLSSVPMSRVFDVFLDPLCADQASRIWLLCELRHDILIPFFIESLSSFPLSYYFKSSVLQLSTGLWIPHH